MMFNGVGEWPAAKINSNPQKLQLGRDPGPQQRFQKKSTFGNDKWDIQHKYSTIDEKTTLKVQNKSNLGGGLYTPCAKIKKLRLKVQNHLNSEDVMCT